MEVINRKNNQKHIKIDFFYLDKINSQNVGI